MFWISNLTGMNLTTFFRKTSLVNRLPISNASLHNLLHFPNINFGAIRINRLAY